MDIPVSRLNKRMALQLPAEFPLGLVFVVGRVRNLTNMDGEDGTPYFYIAENEHMLRCQLSERALEEVDLSEGDMIRAGGHLAFDTLQADYFLLARDIERLPDHRPGRTTLAPILSDIKKRSQAASLAPAELPDWVRQMAPPELRTEDALLPVVERVEEETAEPVMDTAEPVLDVAEPVIETDDPAIDATKITVETAVPVTAVEESAVEAQPKPITTESLPDGFTGDLVDFLSEAMDSPEDVELTHDMVAELAPAIRPEPQRLTRAAQPYDGANVRAETRIPWAIVAVALFFLLAFLGLIFVLALLATT